jgi:hypothetical protein
MSVQDDIFEVSIERIFNLGNYETIKIGLKASRRNGPENAPVDRVITALDKAAIKWVDEKYSDRPSKVK